MNFKTEFPCQPNRREYSRVNAVVPFGVRLVPPEERGSLLSRVCNQTTVDLGGLPEAAPVSAPASALGASAGGGLASTPGWLPDLERVQRAEDRDRDALGF